MEVKVKDMDDKIKIAYVKLELDTEEAEKAIDRLQEKAQKLEDTLERCAQEYKKRV